MRRSRIAAAAAVAALALGGVAAGCGDDDGADVRNVGETAGSASGSGSGGATGRPCRRRRSSQLTAWVSGTVSNR